MRTQSPSLAVSISKVFFLAASIFSPLLIGSSEAEDVRIYYDRGTRIAFDPSGVEILARVELQPEYTYRNNDGISNNSSFGINRARPFFEVKALDGLVSGRLAVELSDGKDQKRDESLKDAWLDVAPLSYLKLRLGQFKVPFGRQVLVDDTKYHIAKKSVATNKFTFGRQAGGMVFGGHEGFYYSTALLNGTSKDEGENLAGVDTRHLGALAAGYASEGFDRTQEGSYGVRDLQYAFGVSAATGSMENDLTGVSDLHLFGGDAEVRYLDVNLSGEYFFREDDFKGGLTNKDEGFHAQVGYFLVSDKWEVASRYARLMPESNLDTTEYATTLTHYLKGHDVKLQLNASFFTTEVFQKRDLSEQEFTFIVTVLI